MVEELRLFIAVNFPNDIKDQLSSIIEEFKKNAVSGNFTHKENLHLTLSFIGETKEQDKVKSAMDRAIKSSGVTKFNLSLQGFGSFKQHGSDILWIGISEYEVLNKINHGLINELKKEGFAAEDKEFKPHLTIGRKVIMNKEFIQPQFHKIESQVDRICLMKSERIKGKLVYTEICNTAMLPLHI